MKRRGMAVVAIALAAVSVLAFGAACGAMGGMLPGASPEERMATAQARWMDYTMGFDQVTDDQDVAAPISSDVKVEGKALKVCFRYISDSAGSGGFVSDNLFDDLGENKIVLKDASGNTYEWLNYISDITLKGDFRVGGFGLADTMPRFSIAFDVPADSSVEDFSLSTGTGNDIPLATYTSAEYEASRSDS